jgi:hypothetical protein
VPPLEPEPVHFEHAAEKNEEPLFASEMHTEEVEPNEMDSVYANIDDIIDGLDIEQERKHEKADSNAGICFK